MLLKVKYVGKLSNNFKCIKFLKNNRSAGVWDDS